MLELIKYKDYTCCIRNNSMDFLCGYVFIPETHDVYNMEHENGIWNVHGGITYSGKVLAGVINPTDGIWIGFDCAHFGDAQDPNTVKPILFHDGTYKDYNYVLNEIKELVDQIDIYEPKFNIELPL